MKSQPWRRGALAALCLGITSAQAGAACPPGEADGASIRQGERVLAYRPLPTNDRGANAMRIPMAQHFALQVQLCDKDGISAADLKSADATMPEHRHGMNYRPRIAPLGGGRFRVDGMMFHMAGHWQLVFEVQAGKETTRFIHDVQIE